MWPFKRKSHKQSRRPKAGRKHSPAHFAMPWESNREWAAAKDTMATHFELNADLDRAYARRNVDGLAPAITACNTSIDLAPAAMKAFRDEHRFWAEWGKEHGIKSVRKVGGERRFRPVSHPGFKQLAIVREREKDYREAIRLCQQAKR